MISAARLLAYWGLNALALIVCDWLFDGITIVGWGSLLIGAAVLGLAIVLEPWLAALIVGLVVLGLGAALLYFGKRRLDAEALAMRRTLNSLREDEAWVREHVS